MNVQQTRTYVSGEIEKALKEQKIGVRELGRRIGVHYNTISRMKNSDRNITFQSLVPILKELGLKIEIVKIDENKE